MEIKEDTCFRIGERYMIRILSINRVTRAGVYVSCMFLDVLRNVLSTRKLKIGNIFVWIIEKFIK